MAHPWDDVVPSSDVEAFAGDHTTIDRPLEAGSRPALIIVDMTREFVDSAYPTGWSDTGHPARDANVRLLRHARTLKVPVYFTKAYPDPRHAPTAVERGRWKASVAQPPDPALPPGDVIVDELAPTAGEIVIHKQAKPSGFFGTPLVTLLIAQQIDTSIVTGMTTSGCVRATALDAFQYNFHVVIPHDACADRSQISHKVTLFDLHMRYADVVTVDATIEYLSAVASTHSHLESDLTVRDRFGSVQTSR